VKKTPKRKVRIYLDDLDFILKVEEIDEGLENTAESDEIIEFPSSKRNDPKLIIMNRKFLLEFLETNDLEIFWIVYGNKHIIGTNFEENKDIRYDINGFFWLEKEKFRGNFYKKEIVYEPLKELMKKYKEKTTKNAIWRGKITKQFRK